MAFWAETNFPSLWSATPTPLTERMRIDEESVARLVDHHRLLGVDGLFLAGTCGEGPWLPVRERRILVRAAREAAGGSMRLAVQVSDNSVEQVCENADWAVEDGADLVVIAAPSFMMNVTPVALRNYYTGVIRRMPLPVCLYDRKDPQGLGPPFDCLKEIYLEENVVMIKDSSAVPARNAVALEVRRMRGDLRIFNGDEFNCVKYLKDGYDGLLIGGAIFNGLLARRIMRAVAEGDIVRAESLQARMNRMMYAVYGGENISCWLGGLKHLLVELGVFSTTRNFLNYEVNPECAAAILEAMESEREVLFPVDCPNGVARPVL